MIKLEPTLENLTDVNFGKPPKEFNKFLAQLGEPHVTSFNYMLREGLDEAIKDIEPMSLTLDSGEQITLKVDEVSINMPAVPAGTVGVKTARIFPTECRQRACTYKGRLVFNISYTVNGLPQGSFSRDIGEIPIMVKSDNCHLSKMTPEQLVAHGEHEEEWGGYFIVKGHERLIRMLLLSRRNYPISIKRPSWKTRGALFSDMGILVRCVKSDQTSTNNVLHYLTDGTAKLMISYNRIMYYIPLVMILKCLCNYTDQYIYQRLVAGYESNMNYCGRIQNMLRLVHEQNLHTYSDCKKFMGSMFKPKLKYILESATEEEIADHLLEKSLLIHLNTPEDKFNLLIFMAQKLFVYAVEGCKTEGVDSVMMQEVMLGGHLYLQILKDRIRSWLVIVRMNIIKRATNPKFSLSTTELQYCCKSGSHIEGSLESFLATGNVNFTTSLGLQQDKGLTIVAENINRMRYMSHFRAVHRGSFFQEMRTTEVRQLCPDAWGFICPVHTPDGSPCGLLNHLTVECKITDVPDKILLANIPFVLVSLGMVPLDSTVIENVYDFYTVILDGKILGYVENSIASRLVGQLRIKKIQGQEVPKTLEIVLVPRKKFPGQFPGLFLFTGPARMMRPLFNLVAKQIELVGTFEQVYLDICLVPGEAYNGITTHMELSKTGFLSNLACLIPMPDNNQSPRNMYQCQMGKQTMGTPSHTWDLVSPTKMYRLQTPTSPLFRPVHHDNIGLDNFAMGTNAIVAVISYTGYDMEDAMIINKASLERGFAHGSIYNGDIIQLDSHGSYFCRNPQLPNLQEHLDTDGLPWPGAIISPGDPFYCYFNEEDSKYYVSKYHGKEAITIANVRVCGSFNVKTPRIAIILYRIQRNPLVGDKFASRAGQKGICSQKWPMEDLPFTETGLVPDIVFNPHGFPSRMTIAMMIELMAGKSAALHGLVHDATPFKFNEEDTAIDYFGKLLVAGGYNYYGTETLYSGIDGREMEAQIFFGIVHYQRLRHMVSDKWQVRSTGPIDMTTRQPIKGRKRGGGVRFGEMERDSLISHGTSFLLQDRLFHCSDKTNTYICTACGTLLGPVNLVVRMSDKSHLMERKETCRLCGHGDNVTEIQIPYIFRYLVTQLASVNINVKIDCSKI